MKTPPSEFAKWNALTATAVDSIDDVEGLPTIVLDLVKLLSPVSIAYVGGYGKHRVVQRFYRVSDPTRTTPPPDPEYHDGSYLLNPFYKLYRDGTGGCFRLLDIMPDGFEETEYYRRFYTSEGMVDEIIHLTPIDHIGAIVIGVVRSNELGPFTPEDVERQADAYPFIAACARRLSSLVLAATKKSVRNFASVDGALEAFGADILTPREQEVINLVLHGHNTVSVGRSLGITADTVKLHRKHAYAKFHVNSQGELFFKFLESLGLQDRSRRMR